ncbi:MAG: SET domain-containing protein-lysine N-methyltransferase [Gemmatimonadaceae bacterium]|nr:SET domain-containing protein-lysine N-methyltransferase [Gemmatimonadaceae bacterium]
MRVCVLQPDYSASSVDYRHFDPPRDLRPFLPGHEVTHLFLDKRTTYRQLRAAATEGFDVFVNLCEGYLEWDVPSIDVIHALDALGVAYTGPPAWLYDPPKETMKYVAHTVGVAVPRHVRVTHPTGAARAAAALRFPLFVKPAKAGDSLGIDAHSRVDDAVALDQQVAHVLTEFPDVLVEEYIDGREFTVLVVGGDDARALTPVEYRFPPGTSFKTYALKTSELHPEANRPVTDAPLAEALRDASIRIFRGFGGEGYARLDFRQAPDGTLHFLEINFTCSVFYAEGFEGSADHILRLDPMGRAGFAEAIIADALTRHRRRQRPFEVHGDALAGFGIRATRALAPGDVVFRGEERSARLATRRHVEGTWSAREQQVLRQYGLPVSDGVVLLWDLDPAEWAPQNHSCDANTTYRGLDVVARRAIAAGEELTLDYAEVMDEHSEPFTCRCGVPGCRGWITGTPGNSIAARERSLR